MSVLEQVLAKSNDEVKIDVLTSETAQRKLAKTYKQNARNCLLAFIIPVILLLSGSSTDSFPLNLKIFLLVYLLCGASWYVFLWNITKKINVASSTPITLFTATSRLRLYTLEGEIFFIVGLTVFFSLFLSNLWNYSPLSFGLVIGTFIFGITFSLTFYVRKIIGIFRDMESLK